MNPILLSFLCGCAFIGGMLATTALVIVVNAFRTKKDRDQLFDYWQQSIQKHTEQVVVLERIAAIMEKREKDGA